MGFGLGSHLLRTPGMSWKAGLRRWGSEEAGLRRRGGGHRCHVEMLNNRMKSSAKPTLTKRWLGKAPEDRNPGIS